MAKTLSEKGKTIARKTSSKKPMVKESITKKIVKETKKTVTKKKPVAPKAGDTREGKSTLANKGNVKPKVIAKKTKINSKK